MSFSQRIGKTQLKKQIQLESIDADLRNSLWNIYNIYILEFLYSYCPHEIEFYSNSLWHHFFKQPTDLIPNFPPRIKVEIRDYFFKCEWFRLYDFIEFNIFILDDDKFKHYYNTQSLMTNFNEILEREFSGYRFINEVLSPITNSTEIEELETSFNITDNFSSLKNCNTHLKSALFKLSDRQNPDYRNSIKESISAVESLAKIISGNVNDTLGAALDKIKGKLKIHPALERGFKQIYGYTSDADGIRHALTEATTCDFEDAKYMIIACSAFINYLIAKAEKAKIKF